MSNLHVDSVTKSYDLKPILTDVFISVDKGDIIGLLGRNGSGKSTLLKIIFGSLEPDNKFVRVDGKIIKSISDRNSIINYLPQNSFLPSHIDVKAIVSVFCDKDTVDYVLNKKVIRKIASRKKNELSSGEIRVLEIYLIVFSKAKFILLDEPFNGVAPIYKDDIKRIIKEESKNKGIIITDHDYYNVLDVSTRLMIIVDGATKEINNKEDLIHFGYLPDNPSSK